MKVIFTPAVLAGKQGKGEEKGKILNINVKIIFMFFVLTSSLILRGLETDSLWES